jgi:pilus assembly protein CpaB
VRGRWSRVSRRYMAASLILSALAVGLVHSYLSRAASASSKAGPGVPVVVAARHIERGSLLRAEDLQVLLVPKRYAQPGALSNVQRTAGRVALADLLRGEAVTETRLARVRAGPVASLVPEGLRAFAVPTSLPVGSLAPGDRVDLLATFTSGQPHTELVVSSVEVLSVLGPSSTDANQPAGGVGLDVAGSSGPGAVTLILLVSPDQEERLAFARAFASLEVTIAPPPA